MINWLPTTWILTGFLSLLAVGSTTWGLAAMSRLLTNLPPPDSREGIWGVSGWSASALPFGLVPVVPGWVMPGGMAPGSMPGGSCGTLPGAGAGAPGLPGPLGTAGLSDPGATAGGGAPCRMGLFGFGGALGSSMMTGFLPMSANSEASFSATIDVLALGMGIVRLNGLFCEPVAPGESPSRSAAAFRTCSICSPVPRTMMLCWPLTFAAIVGPADGAGMAVVSLVGISVGSVNASWMTAVVTALCPPNWNFLAISRCSSGVARIITSLLAGRETMRSDG